MVLNNDLHHPSLVARAAATLDVLSDGRFELGLGAGHSKPEYERAGIGFDPPATRVDRLEEAVALLRRLLDGETVSHVGPHYRLHDERCDPPPVQDHVPLLVGGGGKRVLTLAARSADTVGFTGLGRTLADGQHHDPSGFAPEQVDRDVAIVRAAADGRSATPELQVLVQAVVITDDARGAAESIVANRLPSLTADQVLSTPYLLVGSEQGIVDQLVRQRERWGFSHYTVRADAIDQFAPVVEALAGT
jgi:probable F420-dependent oxidoreductase